MSHRKVNSAINNDRLLSLLSKHSLTETHFYRLVQPPYFAQKENRATSSNAPNIPHVEKERKVEEFVYVKEKDKLFWYLMMIVNQWEIDDLPEPKERFYYEKDEKTKAVELLQKSSIIHWKELKLPKTEICTNLACGSRRPLTLPEFEALCYLYEKNLLLHWGKCYYKIRGGITGPDQTWYIIVRTKSGDKLVSEGVRDLFYNRIVSEYFQVKNLQKKLGSEASYKLNELEEIARKLKISITKDNGKKMRKKEIYSLLLNETEKID